MEIKIKLFASLAETAGWRERSIQIADGATVLMVWAATTREAVLPARTLCAINMDYCTVDAMVHAGDEIAFFPPVTGG